ncbi:restriction endonuclease subunit S [uncultured Butyricimonas sp.]|uniref:restriction endonuclease subunit S n=1 Tax=uncultured Butyricimonas sp. TaxID=1268785 RepID=UPI002594DC3E|nr:restriction endonuclease subunit S [uncultured Butyricimonas sp.]
MEKDMQSYRLSDLVKIKNGKDHKMLSNGKHPVLGSGGIMRYVDRFLYNKPSVLLPRKGTLDNIQYCDVPFWTVDTLYYTEVNTNLANPYYLYRYLSLLDLSNLDSGTGVPSMTFDNYYGLKIFLPNIEKQTKIAQILQTLDKKITINRQINQNLEAMAKQLYDYWFVQFDFPNEEGKPYKSSGGKMVWNEKLKREIPEKWHSDNICLIADILSGGTPSKQINEYWNCGNIPFFGPTDYNGSMFQLQTADKITESGLQHCSSALFEENTIIITARGSIGKLVIVGTPMAMNQSCYALKSRNGEYEYLYFLTIQMIESLKAKGSGSVFKSIIASDIENTMLCVANRGIISLFCDKVCPIMKQIKKNTQEMIHLTKQRDELLPLLMNGQVSVNSDLSNGL